MKQIFGIDKECVQAIARLSNDEMVALAELEAKSNTEERSLISKVLSALRGERWADWMEGIEVRSWLLANQRPLFYTIGNEIKELRIFTETSVDESVWLVLTWIEMSMQCLVFKDIAPNVFEKTPAVVYRKLFPLVREALMKRACDRSWQERAVLENYLGGLEAKLMEAEVQEVLLN